MGEGIVAGEHRVEGALDLGPETAHVGDAEGERRAAGGGLAPGAGDRAAADVGGVHPVAARRQADRLGADAAGAVEQAMGTGAERHADQAVEHLGLAGEGLVPVVVDQVVVGGEPVVEVRRATIPRTHRAPLPSTAARVRTPCR